LGPLKTPREEQLINFVVSQIERAIQKKYRSYLHRIEQLEERGSSRYPGRYPAKPKKKKYDQEETKKCEKSFK
jgi:hypothetical protein